MTRDESFWSWKPKASLKSPKWEQQPKDLSHHLLFTQAIKRVLYQKWSSWDSNCHLYGMLELQAYMPPLQPQRIFKDLIIWKNHREKRVETEKSSNCWFTLKMFTNGLELGQSQARRQELKIWVSKEGIETQPLDSSFCFPRNTSKELIGNRATDTQIGTLVDTRTSGSGYLLCQTAGP